MKDNVMKSILSALAAITISCMVMFVGVSGSDATMSSPDVKISLPRGHGSGVHLGRGLFLTAEHVVEDVDNLKVITNTGREMLAEVAWKNKDYDLAAVRTPLTPNMKVSHLDCRPTHIGEVVHGVGNPLYLDNITTWGRVAGAPLPLDGAWRTVYSVDMTIAPGMSGGPLYSDDNTVIGIMVGLPVMGNKQFLTGIGFVVPSTAACDLMAH
jgi:S1-C subfamily serine protease